VLVYADSGHGLNLNSPLIKRYLALIERTASGEL
jgi:hypothetical protein